MEPIDQVNRPGTGPLPSPEADPFGAVRHEHRVTNKPPVVREVVEIPAATLPSVTVSSSNVPVPAPAAAPASSADAISAADVEIASKRYIAALASREKAQARVAAAKSELTAALQEESTAAEVCRSLQQELLDCLK